MIRHAFGFAFAPGKMPALRWLCLPVLLAFLGIGTDRANAQSILLRADETRVFQNFYWLPYAFFSESFGLGFGAGGGYSGWPEEETSLLGALTLGTKGSYNVVASATDLRVPGFRRLYMQPLLILGSYQDQYLYIGQDNPGFEGQRAGANDSDTENFREATQWDYRFDLEFRYLLPLGHGTEPERIVNRYVLQEGLLKSGASGGTSWNPLSSGRSYLHLTPQWRAQTLKQDDLELPLDTLNLELKLERDNTDFPYNPTHGSTQELAYRQDFLDTDGLGEWALWTFEYSKVFDLGPGSVWNHEVLAFDVWTAYVPTWETASVDGQERVVERPPQYAGAILGGIERMRAYEDNRYQDKAAVYYSLEYRVIPHWQPLRNADLLEFADISFWQWVLFAEVGQVAPHWNVDDLHDDLHVDGGVSLRGMLHNAVCRLDFAMGEEGNRIIAMYGHPF